MTVERLVSYVIDLICCRCGTVAELHSLPAVLYRDFGMPLCSMVIRAIPETWLKDLHAVRMSNTCRNSVEAGEV
jgi:hypothetical protein